MLFWSLIGQQVYCSVQISWQVVLFQLLIGPQERRELKPIRGQLSPILQHHP